MLAHVCDFGRAFIVVVRLFVCMNIFIGAFMRNIVCTIVYVCLVYVYKCVCLRLYIYLCV